MKTQDKRLGGPTLRRPSLRLLGTEPWRAAREFRGFVSQLIRRRPPPRGDGHPVIVFPGLASSGHAVAPLCSHCRKLGYDALDWGRGWNTGPSGSLDEWLHALAADVQQRLREHGHDPDREVTLIGWSLGGIYARELAKLRLHGLRVRQVITIGTPFNGEPRHTHAAWVYRVLNGAHPPQGPALRERLRTAPPTPTTSIYSRGDGIVAWQACRHDSGQAEGQVQDIEVEGSHLGMGWNPQVLRVVADRLAQPAGQWRPYIGAAV